MSYKYNLLKVLPAQVEALLITGTQIILYCGWCGLWCTGRLNHAEAHERNKVVKETQWLAQIE